MNNEVEEFLRRAAARRAQVEAQMRAQAEAKARGQQPLPSQPAYVPPRPAPPPQRMPQVFPQQQAYDIPMARPAQVELAENRDRLGSGVAAHLRGAEQISQHTAHLSDRVDAADDEMEARLHQTFDHKVGRLTKTTEETPAVQRQDSNAEASIVAQATVLGIAHMLQSPQNIRSAIILNEVFNRPLDRW